MTSRRLAAALFGLLALGCQPRDLAWGFQIDEPLDADTRGLASYVREDACEGDAPPLSVLRFRRGASPDLRAPTLPSGTYYLAVEALDAECRVIGRGCAPTTLPTDARVVVEVRALPEPGPDACESGARCSDGLCELRDGG